MKLITIFGKTFRPRGEARKWNAPSVERAMRNAARPNVNEKFHHPRSERLHPSQKP